MSRLWYNANNPVLFARRQAPRATAINLRGSGTLNSLAAFLIAPASVASGVLSFLASVVVQ